MRHLRVWVLALALVIAPWAAALTAPTVTLAEPTIIGYADGSTLGVGVGPIYRVPDTFGGPDPYFIRYPAPSLNPSASTEPVGNSNTIHDPGPAMYSEPFEPSGRGRCSPTAVSARTTRTTPSRPPPSTLARRPTRRVPSTS